MQIASKRLIRHSTHVTDQDYSLQSTGAGGFPLICDRCYHHKGCKLKPTPEGRCNDYLKNGRIDLDDELDINPMDTFTFDYDTLKKLVKDLHEEHFKSE
jgi:hypothetical protein